MREFVDIMRSLTGILGSLLIGIFLSFFLLNLVVKFVIVFDCLGLLLLGLAFSSVSVLLHATTLFQNMRGIFLMALHHASLITCLGTIFFLIRDYDNVNDAVLIRLSAFTMVAGVVFVCMSPKLRRPLIAKILKGSSKNGSREGKP